MRTIEQVANEPQPGDEAAFIGGKIIYRVMNVVIGPDPSTRLPLCTVETEREETLRATKEQMNDALMLTVDPSVLVKKKKVLFQGQGWADLVKHGCSTVRTFELPAGR